MFIHSPVDRHLACFHLLAVVPNAAMNLDYKYLFEFLISVLWGIYLGLELLGHMLILFNFLCRGQTCFLSSCIIYIPFSRAKVFRFLHIFPNSLKDILLPVLT